MEVTNTFRVNAPERQAWDVITDVERVVPMLPGAQLDESEGDAFRGAIRVNIGSVTVDYRGTASFVERNQADGRVVVKASGRDIGGQGNASVVLTATLVPDGEGTRITLVVELTTTGKVAQFGRQVLTDVSDRIILHFIEAFEADLAADGPDADTASPDAAPSVAPPLAANPGAPVGNDAVPPDRSEPAPVDRSEPEPVDLLDAAGGSAVKRLVPLLGGLGALILALLIGRSRRRE